MIYPIRMDVSMQASNSQSPSVRVIDTVLIDPKVCNASKIAYDAMADAQVLSLAREQNSSGRVDYDLARAWKEATVQVEDQLRSIQETESKLQNQRIAKLKRPLDVQDDDTTEDKDQKTKQMRTQPASLFTQEKDSNTSSDGDSKDCLIPVHLRISINGIRIHDDFHWDPSLTDFTPLQMAESIAADLLLPDDTIPAMAICIAEQVYQPLSSSAIPKDDDSPVINTSTTAAWKIAATTTATRT